jgi:MFS family permease
MFLFSASTAAAASYGGGYLSDRVGRKSPIVLGLLGQSIAIAGLLFVGHHVVAGFAVVVLAGVLGAPARSSSTAIVADLVPQRRHETAYATVRVATNLGAVLGPPLGGLLLLGSSWSAFLTGVVVLGLVAAGVAARWLPDPRPRHDGIGARRGASTILGDTSFLFLIAATFFGFVVYVAFETVLPIALVSSYGLSASTWGFLAAINPVLVTLCQRSVTRRVADVPPGRKIALALVLMGFPFLLLLAASSIAVVVVVIVVFVVGEMLWSPTALALAGRLAPPTLRGAYMGAYGASSTVAWTVAPFVALQLRGAAGDGAMWTFFAGAAVAGALTAAAAARRAPAAEGVRD